MLPGRSVSVFFGGVPSLVLTDNKKHLNMDHVCQLPVRNQKIVTTVLLLWGVHTYLCAL
jgi:hypothetical protein